MVFSFDLNGSSLGLSAGFFVPPTISETRIYQIKVVDLEIT